jgi:hypothetical protein
MYFSPFCGRTVALAHADLRLGLRPREAWTFVALVIALVGLGLRLARWSIHGSLQATKFCASVRKGY